MRTAYFYLLENDSVETYTRSVCQLVDQWWSQGLRLYLYCESQETAQRFDDALWTFRDIRFVPHRLITNHPALKNTLPSCVVGFPEAVNNPSPGDILLNLNETIPEFFSQYETVVEVVLVDEKARVRSRQRYKQYQQAGYFIKTQHFEKP